MMVSICLEKHDGRSWRCQDLAPGSPHSGLRVMPPSARAMSGDEVSLKTDSASALRRP
jgi:hypothetical protein